jgi:hypothetical protein
LNCAYLFSPSLGPPELLVVVVHDNRTVKIVSLPIIAGYS